MSQPPAQQLSPGGQMEAEMSSQPQVWRQAAEQAEMSARDLLPTDGQRVAVVGCGTSWFMAQSYAVLRELAGKGTTDAFAASEFSGRREYDAVMAISRSGTTTEVLEVLGSVQGKVPTVAILGDPASPARIVADSVVELPYADEASVVQTRFATAALVYLRTALGLENDTAIIDAEDALQEDVPQELTDAEQFTFLGRGWTLGLAHEAALKMREASQSWTESYPAMEYRHGPIAIAATNRVTWLFGEEPAGLAGEVSATGALFVCRNAHPLAELVRVQKVALHRALARGLNPDLPRNLSRSVILAHG